MVGWHHRLNGHESEQTLGDRKDKEAWCAAVHGVAQRKNHTPNRSGGKCEAALTTTKTPHSLSSIFPIYLFFKWKVFPAFKHVRTLQGAISSAH